MRIAPRPEDFAPLFVKKTQMDREIQDLPAETIEAIDAPTLLIIGDSDIVRPEHAVEMFRLLGGGVIGDLAGLPNSQLTILPAPLTQRSWSAAIGWVRWSRHFSMRRCPRPSKSRYSGILSELTANRIVSGGGISSQRVSSPASATQTTSV